MSKVTSLKVRIVNTLGNNGPLKFSKLISTLRVRNEKRLDNTLQELRKSGSIHFVRPTVGWNVGGGAVYSPMSRLKTRRGR